MNIKSVIVIVGLIGVVGIVLSEVSTSVMDCRAKTRATPERGMMRLRGTGRAIYLVTFGVLIGIATLEWLGWHK